MWAKFGGTNYPQLRGSLFGDYDKNCRVRKYTPHPILIKHCVAVSSATSNVAHHARVFPVFPTCTSPSSKMHLCGGGQGALWLYLVIHLDMDSLSPWGAPGWTGEAPASNAPQVYLAPPPFHPFLLLLSNYTSNSMKFHTQKKMPNLKHRSWPKACSLTIIILLLPAVRSSKVYWLAWRGGQRGVLYLSMLLY